MGLQPHYLISKSQTFSKREDTATNLANPFVATLIPTPEPGFYGALALGIVGLAFFVTRLRHSRNA